MFDQGLKVARVWTQGSPLWGKQVREWHSQGSVMLEHRGTEDRDEEALG